jgi:flavorubredoxin
MKAVVIYESRFGATRAVAEAIGRGLAAAGADVRVADVRVAADGIELIRDADLVVVGSPTHGRTIPRGSAFGVRRWLQVADFDGRYGAAFGTRFEVSGLLAGSAARAIARRMDRGYAILVDRPHDFLVQRDGRLTEHELDHAYEWGRVLPSELPVLVAAGHGDAESTE